MRGIIVFWMICLIMLLLNAPAFASDVVPIERYHFEKDPDMPEPLYVGQVLECGDYSIRLLQQPVIGKYTNKLIADNELEYLMVRVAIVNKSNKIRGWLNPNSFKVLEIYKGHMFSTYDLDVSASAVTAEGFGQPAYFEEIGAGDTLYTTLVFSVYPEVDGWVMRFAPRAYYEDAPAETVTFQLPKAVWYSEGN